MNAVRTRILELAGAERDGCSAGISEADWCKVFGDLNFQHPEYALPVMAYHHQYLSEKHEEFIAFPIVLAVRGKPAGIWPLCCFRTDRGWKIGSNSGGITKPALLSTLGRNERKRLFRWCLDFLNAGALELGIQKLDFVTEEEAGDLESWYWILLNSMPGKVDVRHHVLVNLELPLEEIRSCVRKSYRPLVSKAERLWNVCVLDKIDDEVIEELRNFHIRVAGRETRSRTTWELQKAFINCGHGFMILVRSQDNRLVGGAIFSAARDYCSYDVGVYDRNLFDLPIGHVTQMRAIEHARSLGCSVYHIGWRPFPEDGAQATEKEQKIGVFKQGFATRFSLRLHFSTSIEPISQ